MLSQFIVPPLHKPVHVGFLGIFASLVGLIGNDQAGHAARNAVTLKNMLKSRPSLAAMVAPQLGPTILDEPRIFC